MPLSRRGPSKLGELPRARRLTRGIGHRVNSTAKEGQARRKRVGNGRGRRGNGLEAEGHACPRKEGEGTSVSARKSFPEKKRAAFLQGNRKRGNSEVVSYLCRGDPLSVTGPPSRWTDTYLAGRRYASESRSRAPRSDRPAGRFLLSVVTGGSRVPARDARRLSACLGPGPGCPGTCPRARAPARARRSGSRARSVPAFWESNRTRRAPSLPGLPGAGASGRAVERRLPVPSLLLRAGRPSGDLTLGPTSHS